MSNLNYNLHDQCLLIDQQSCETCKCEFACKCFPSFYDYKAFNEVAIYCQHVIFQMLHKDCPKLLLHYLHVLHNATNNQQHVRLSNMPTCFSSWTCDVYGYLLFLKNLNTQYLIAITSMKWFSTNLFHAREIPFWFSKCDNYCYYVFQCFKHWR
jgi:hypothetical protein